MKAQPRTRSRELARSLFLTVGLLTAGCERGATTEPPAPGAEPGAGVEPASAAPETALENLPDLILVTIDACRPDRTSAYGYPQPTTPALEALASEGLLFERASTSMPLALPAHATILTGSLPPVHGVRDDLETSLDPARRTLAAALAERGYRTGAFVGSLRLHAKYGLDSGFERYDDEIESSVRFGTDPASRPAAEVVRRAGEWLAGLGDDPAFLFVNLAEPDAPRETPLDEVASSGERYDAELRAADRALATLVERLRELGRLDDSWILVTSGSGQAFGEHGELGHGYLLHEATTRIPMVLRPAGGGAAHRVDSPVSLVDVFPTLLAAAGMEAGEATGVELLSLVDRPRPDRAVYSESILPTRYGRSPLFSLTVDGWKLVLSSSPALYDLAQDPGETRNLVVTEGPRAAELEAALKRIAGDRGLQDPPPHEFLDEHLLYSGFGARLENHEVEAVLAACDELDAEHPGLRATAYWRIKAELAAATSDRSTRTIEGLKAFLAEFPVRRKPAKAKLEPFSSTACFELGLHLVEEGRGSEAIYPLRDALRVRPRETTGHLALGEAFVQLDRMTQAVRSLELAARIEPTADLENTIATIYSRGGAFDKALQHYERAVELGPELHLVHANLARCYLFHERIADAIGSYRRSLELEPAQPEVELELAYLLVTAQDEPLQDHQAAVEGIERALKGGLPISPDTLDGVALVYARAGSYDLAVKFADRAVQLAREKGDAALENQIFERYSEYARKARKQARE